MDLEKREARFNIALAILVAILIIVILLFIGSIINGDKLLNT